MQPDPLLCCAAPPSREISPPTPPFPPEPLPVPLLEDILNSISAQVAVLGADGRILQVNRAWTEFGQDNSPAGLPASSLGVDYIAFCRACSGPFSADAAAAAQGIEDVLLGRRDHFSLEYPCDSPTEQRWFEMHVTPLAKSGQGAVVSHYNITGRKHSELRVSAQTRQFELALAAAHMGVWSYDATSGQVRWSQEVHQILQVPSFDGTLEAWEKLVHPDDLLPMRERFFQSLQTRMPFTAEFRVVRPDGSIRWIANVAEVECGPDGVPRGAVGTIVDITDRKRSEWALVSYNRILELIATGADLARTMQEVVRLVEDQLPGSLCSILLVESGSGRLRFGAAPSLPDSYNRAVDGVPIGPEAGSCGTAAFRKQTVVVHDIANDPLWRNYRGVALEHGLRSCVSVPIFSSGNVPGMERGSVIGTFALYRREPVFPDPLTFAILSGAEKLASEAISSGNNRGDNFPGSLPLSARVIEAAHLAGVAIERNQAERAVRESEERFRHVLDSSPAAMFLKDFEGRYLFVNCTMASLFGLPANQWPGRFSRDLFAPPLADFCDQCDLQVRESLASLHDRHTLRLPSGREVTVLATHFPLFAHEGQPYAICGFFTDITDLVSVQRDLFRLWAHAPEPLCAAGYDGYFKQINAAWSRCLGWPESDLLGQPWIHFIHPDDRPSTEAMFLRLTGGEPIQRFECRFRALKGGYRWFSWDAIPLPSEQTFYGFLRDVTVEKQLAEQFRQAQKMEAVGQLASGVAHDFNNLLTVINGYTDLLLDGLTSSHPSHEPLAQVRAAGQRATELTAQLLAFSRKAIVEPKVLDLNQVVESSARMLRRLIGEDVHLLTHLAPIPPVRIDPCQLEQILMNLAVNARDAMPRGGRLAISTDSLFLSDANLSLWPELSPGQFIRLTFSDSGCGMSPEVKSRIFEPFFTTKGIGKGTGLGLATVYGIVRQAGGSIGVESEAGRGTVFQILLPAELESAPGTATPFLTIAPRGSETVMLVEDEPGVRKVARTILEFQGYSVLEAASGMEVLQLESRHRGTIHILVTDVVMPDLGGRALVDAIRARRPGIRVLFMSGYTDDAILRHGVQAAQDFFIQKPFTPLSLARRVREVLDKPGS